jgi:Bacterial virulence protein (VirJ)
MRACTLSSSVSFGGRWAGLNWLCAPVFGSRGCPVFDSSAQCPLTAGRDSLVASAQRRSCHLSTVVCLLILASFGAATTPACSQTRQSVDIRGHQQSLFIYGSPRGDPVIVSSGDGGWIHFGPHVAEFLSSQGFYVIGFDVKAYLSGFTSGRSTLRAEDEPGDYHVLTQFARKSTGKRPILIGVSEGAGLSVLAATDPATKADIAGVIGLGLPDLNELGWRWKDAVIYLTHRAPNEPTFSAAAVVDRVTPVPLAAIHSTHDEFVPVAEVERVLKGAKDPKRLWTVAASNHRFSDNLAAFDRQLLDAIAWVKANSPR